MADPNEHITVTRASDGALATREEKNDAAGRKLLEAAKLIETALILLDTSYEHCGGCGSRHWNNRAHANVYERLTDTPSKLRSAAEQVTMSETKKQSNRRGHGRRNS